MAAGLPGTTAATNTPFSRLSPQSEIEENKEEFDSAIQIYCSNGMSDLPAQERNMTSNLAEFQFQKIISKKKQDRENKDFEYHKN